MNEEEIQSGELAEPVGELAEPVGELAEPVETENTIHTDEVETEAAGLQKLNGSEETET